MPILSCQALEIKHKQNIDKLDKKLYKFETVKPVKLIKFMSNPTKRFAPNLETKGRVIRGLLAAALLIGGLAAWDFNWILSLVLIASGVFVVFEALRGWCVVRACGIKTKF
jgi:hypothetical protein